MTGLGIDGGASSSRWLLLDDAGQVQGRGVGGPLTGHLFAPEDRQRNLDQLRDLLTEVLSVARPDAVVAGITGLEPGGPEAAMFVQLIAERLELPEEAVTVDNDMLVAYAGAFAPGQGMLLYAGTGSVAYYRDESGRSERAGGYGYLIDDAGAGFWIGQQGIREVMRQYDRLGRPPDGALAEAVHRELGARDWPGIRAAVYGGGRSRVARLTKAVAEAARRGDRTAARILEQAGQELALLAGALLQRLDRPLPVAFAGGVARHLPEVATALQASLPAGTPFRRVDLEPVESAARLALRAAR